MTPKNDEYAPGRATSRRSFLKIGSMGVTAVGLRPHLVSGAVGGEVPPKVAQRSGPVPDRAALIVEGEWYDASVPDTLDLAKRGEFSVNVLTRNVEPENFYSVYQGFNMAKPDLPARKAELLLWNGTAKNARTLPWMRTMCGSQQGIDAEFGMMQVLAGAIDKQGQVRYVPAEASSPAAGSTANPIVNALLLLGMENWQQRDGNPAWRERMALLSRGLQQIAIRVEDRAYYPLECGYDTDGSWRVLRKGHLLPYTAPEEPTFDQQGAEGAVKVQNARQMAALARYAQLTGDRDALEMSRRIARFILKPTMWVDAASEGIAGHEHGIWEGHFHGNVYALHMLATLAVIDNDPRLKQFVVEGYHHAHRFGVTPMGWFPGWTYPPPDSAWGKGRPPAVHNTKTEGCGVADMVVLAVKLSDAGLGDYWDDVDHITRNQLVEQQLIDLELMRKCAGGDPKHDAALSRFVGGFGAARPTANLSQVAGCCTANCAVGLYHAWHGITRFMDGVATVNLFLNRASAWMDVDSYLPYEGKVVLRNKTAHTALVRVPGWLRAAPIKSTVNTRARQPIRTGNYLLFQNLKPRDEVRLEFPVTETVREYTMAAVKYRLVFRGSTIVDISPRPEEPGTYPIFLREHMKATTAPMINVKRFAPHRILPLQ